MSGIFRIIRAICILLSGLLIISPAIAQTGNDGRSVLWEISGNGLKASSFLFGTIHLIAEKDYFFTPAMQQKFDSCSALTMEVDINMTFSQQLKMARDMLLPEGHTLQDYMDETDYTFVKSYMLDSMKIKPSRFRKYTKFKPFFLSSLVAISGMGKTKTYEKEFNQMAKHNGMLTLGLETLEFQMSLIEKTSIEDQARSLITELRAGRENRAMLDSLVAAYKAQDIDKLYTFISMGSGADQGFMKDYLVSRNNKWIPEIERIAHQQRTFFAVGAGHLGSETGLIALLRQKGYTVKAVK